MAHFRRLNQLVSHIEGKEVQPAHVAGSLKEPIRVVLTGAAGQIGYALIPQLCNGSVFGHDQPVILHLLDIKKQEKVLGGVVMEIQDCAYPLLQKVIATSDTKEGFTGVNVAVLVGGFPRLPGMERKDLLNKNKEIFVEQGQALKKYAHPDVKVVVVANPANTNCLIAIENACGPDSKLNPKNFTCLTRLDLNRAKYQLAARVGAQPVDVKNIIIWGNHSSTMFPDIVHAQVKGTAVPKIPDAANKFSEQWLNGFVKIVQQRGAAILQARGLSSALSAASATADHLRDWLRGAKSGEIVSMGVLSDGSYGIKKGIVYSYPCLCTGNGNYTIVQGLSVSDYARKMMTITEKELLEEKAMVGSQ